MGGLTAAVAAAQSGVSRILLIEKLEQTGGSMALSAGNFGTFPTVEAAEKYTPESNRDLQQIVIEDLPSRIRWLRSLGIRITWTGIIFDSYISWKTTAGELHGGLFNAAKSVGVTIRTSTSLADLESSDGGWAATLDFENGRKTISVTAVILAGGGFQGNVDLVRRYLGRETHNAYRRANLGSNGDTLRAALAVGATTSTGMNTFYGHAMPSAPARFGPNNYPAMTQYYGSRGVAIDLEGERFVDESEGIFEENVNWALAGRPNASGFYIFDSRVDSGGDQELAGEIAKRAESAGGIVLRADSMTALASQLAQHGVPEERVANTLDGFARALRDGRGHDLVPPRRRRLEPLVPPYTAVAVTAGITMTTGGLATNSEMALLDELGNRITGLFAAGADVGAISGHGYLGGLPSALTTGFEAASSAAAQIAATRMTKPLGG